jgi:two-component system OmpR family sensor kinase/two-component system sensor histidine kinase BaeS
MYMAGSLAFRSLGSFPGDMTSPTTIVWADRLAAFYSQQGGWNEVDVFIDGYPCQPDWGPWNADWQMNYVLASDKGIVVAASETERLGRSLNFTERIVSAPVIDKNGQQVGRLLLFPLGQFGARLAFQIFLLSGLVMVALSLVVSLALSRRISRPFTDLISASHSISSGDLSVRISTVHSGTAGQLVAAFNQMAGDLERADELRRNMTADIAHELRTPLSVMRGKLEGVMDGVYTPTEEHLAPILQQTWLLTRLVDDLHFLALADAGQLPLEMQAVDFSDLLRDVYVNFYPQANDRGVTLALDLPTGLPKVLVDRRRITQVLGNLMTNSLHHTPQGGQVTLTAEKVDEHLAIIVVDTGVGIPNEDLPYVFERFWRGEKSRSRSGGGSGLGLAIAKQIVELHGGEISVKSAPGRGTIFRIVLPVS